MGSASRARAARWRRWACCMALAAALAAAQEETAESPVPPVAAPSLSFDSETATSSGGAESSPATVGPSDASADAPADTSTGSSASETLSPSPSPSPATETTETPASGNLFGLVLSASSNAFVDLLEIVRNGDASAPRISFESMTDKLSWDVNKWEDPLTQLSNMITNEHIAVAADELRLDVKLVDPANATTVSFTKKNEWKFGPTLVLNDAALSGLSDIKNLEFSNFNISFQGAHWLPTGSNLKKLAFTKSTIATFNVSEEHSIAAASWKDSMLDSFPTALLSLKTPPTSLSIESCTFSKPLALTDAEFESLRSIPSLTLSDNKFPAPASSSDCSMITSYHSQSICITTPVSSGTPSSQSSTATIDDLPGTSPYGASQSKLTKSNAMLHTLVAVACAVGGIAIVVGFVWIRRRKDGGELRQHNPLTLSNHNDKFLGDDDEMSSPRARDTGLSARTTTATTAGGGILSDVDLGPHVIRSEGRLGTNGLFRAEYQGEAVVALRVNVGNLGVQDKNVESIVASCVELRHPHMVEFIGTSLTGADDMWLVAEMMAKGSLRSVIMKKKIELTWEKIQTMSLHIASALDFVQSVRSPSALLTPTLSTRSVLCDSDWNCKLDVFEFAEPCRDYAAPIRSFGQGEIAYRAPELLANPDVSQLSSTEVAMAEVYALGVIFCELSLRALAYSDIFEEQGVTMGEMHVAREVLANRLRPEPAADTPSEYADIITACLASDPMQRPNVTQVVDWLNNISK